MFYDELIKLILDGLTTCSGFARILVEGRIYREQNFTWSTTSAALSRIYFFVTPNVDARSVCGS